jgi:hypothetical protein
MRNVGWNSLSFIALIGDSAGGGLAVTTMLCAREQGLPLPAATMPLSPWLDMEAKGETFETNAARDLIVTRDMIQMMAATFLGQGGNRQEPLANPLHADLTGFPPIPSRPELMRRCSMTVRKNWRISRASPAYRLRSSSPSLNRSQIEASITLLLRHDGTKVDE